MSGAAPTNFDAVIAAGIQAQRWVPGSIAVGGSAAALLAHHRLSVHTDHLVSDLSTRFEQVLTELERQPDWRTARVEAPVLILGSIGGVQVGFRQARHRGLIETQAVEAAGGRLVIPTLDEMIGMKGYLAYRRNATRDFLDFAALADRAGDFHTLHSLLKSDERYGHLQRHSVALSIAGRLTDPRPHDLEDVSLESYKGLLPEWRDWSRVHRTCVRMGRLLGERVALGS